MGSMAFLETGNCPLKTALLSIPFFEYPIGPLIISFTVYLGERRVEGFGNRQVAVIDFPTDGKRALAVPVCSGFTDFLGPLVFAGCVGDVTAFGIEFVSFFVLK
ncbi:MAG: hypothetical protein DRO01_01460 [Thermoproteota archaeon]|nr:MAG: hypothetical protein DRO01_01460 [Candidatus Korarchaeota archaeon]